MTKILQLKNYDLPYLEVIAEERFFVTGCDEKELMEMSLDEFAKRSNLPLKQLLNELGQIKHLAHNIFINEDDLKQIQNLRFLDVNSIKNKKNMENVEWFYEQDPYQWYLEAKEQQTGSDVFISSDLKKAFSAAMYFREHGVKWIQAAKFFNISVTCPP